LSLIGLSAIIGEIMERFITYVLKEARIIRRASLIFATAILVIAGVLFYGIWQAMDWRYSGIIANINAELSSAKAVRDEYKDKLQGATPDQAKARVDDLEARVRRLEPRTISPEQRRQIEKFVQMPTGSQYVMVIDASLSEALAYVYFEADPGAGVVVKRMDSEQNALGGCYEPKPSKIFAHTGSAPETCSAATTVASV
jgi:hypothetical protein